MPLISLKCLLLVIDASGHVTTGHRIRQLPFAPRESRREPIAPALWRREGELMLPTEAKTFKAAVLDVPTGVEGTVTAVSTLLRAGSEV